MSNEATSTIPAWAGGGNEEAKQERVRQEQKRIGMNTFRLKKGESRTIVFLEDIHPKTFGCFRHKLRISSDFKDDFEHTCSRGQWPCLTCEKKYADGDKKKEYKKKWINAVTVVELLEYEYVKEGKKIIVPCQKKLLVMGEEIFDLLCSKSAKKKQIAAEFKDKPDEIKANGGDPEGLKLWIFDVKRGNSDTTFNTGNDFEPVSKLVNPRKLPGMIKLKDGTAHPGLVTHEGKDLDLKPYEYFKLYVPPSRAELDRFYATHNVTDGYVFKGKGGGESGGPDPETEENAPPVEPGGEINFD